MVGTAVAIVAGAKPSANLLSSQRLWNQSFTGLAGGDAGDLASVDNAAHLLQLSAKIWARTALTLTTEMHMPMAPATGLSQTQLTILHGIAFPSTEIHSLVLEYASSDAVRKSYN